VNPAHPDSVAAMADVAAMTPALNAAKNGAD